MSDGENLLDDETVAGLENQHGPVCVIKSMGRVFAFRRAKKDEARRYRRLTKDRDDDADQKLMQSCVVYCGDGDALPMLNQHLDEYVFADTGIASALVKFCGFDPKLLGGRG